METNRLINKLIATSTHRAKRDVQHWRSALRQAENTDSPKRASLYNIYEDVILDGHLSSLIQKRTMAVIGSSFAVHKDTEIDVEKTELLKKPWFVKFLKIAMESIYWGHSLLQIGDLVDGEISTVELIKRKHIIPEKGMFTIRQGDETGIRYREDKKYYDYLIEIGETHDLGLLNPAVPHALYKRFATGAWSEYAELFGAPTRYAKTNTKDAESLNRMEDMMINMGSFQYAIIDDSEELNFIETSKTNGEVYERLITQTNSELSKIIQGTVIGEASQGGSRSKEEVGERTTQEITRADKQWVQGYINHFLFPKLIKLGYPLQNCRFQWQKSKDINSLWNITKGLLPHYNIDEEFISDTFGIPVTKKTTESPQKKTNSLPLA